MSPLRLTALAILIGLPTCDVLAGDAYPTTTVLTSKFEITNHTIEPNPIFSMTGTNLLTDPNDIGNGLYLIKDDFSTAKFSSLGNYDRYRLGLKLRDSIINITMVGKNLGHSFNVKGRYLSAQFTVTGLNFFIAPGGVVTFVSTTKNGGDCTSKLPNQFDDPLVFSIKGNSMDITKRCLEADTGIYNYAKSGPSVNPSLIPNSREILLDIGGLQKDPAYRKAPPDIYVGSVTSNKFNGFSVERWEQPTAYIMRYQNNVTIQKNPYFEGITLPAGDNVFDVKTVGGQIKGNLTIPYVMNGQFTPYNKIELKVTSGNDFKLKDISNNEIPYSLSTTIGIKKIDIASNGAAKSLSSILTYTNLSKEFYALQGHFDADFSVSQAAVREGDYTDIVTAVYTILL